MPIPFHCPHCGAFTEVDDVYAGHSGPCATCNKPITIPYLPAAMSPQPRGARAAMAATTRTRSGALVLLAVVASGVLALVLLAALGMALVQPALQAMRNTASQTECARNLQQIGMALQAYHAAHNTYPPAFIPDADGKPMHSWRVLILPYLGDQAMAVYRQYRFDLPWDSPENLSLAGFMPEVYACPEHPDARQAQETTYRVVVGKNSLFPGAQCVSGEQMLDPPGETIMVIETPQSGLSWLKPQDLEADQMSYEINGRQETDPGSHHPTGGAHVLTADGEVYLLPDEFSPDYLNGMATINGREGLPTNVLDGFRASR